MKATSKFPLLIHTKVALPCVCGTRIDVDLTGTTGSEEVSTIVCNSCGSEYDVKILGIGQIDVVGVRVSYQARMDKIRRLTCEKLGVSPEKLSIRNGRGAIETGRFMEVLTSATGEVNNEIAQYEEEN